MSDTNVEVGVVSSLTEIVEKESQIKDKTHFSEEKRDSDPFTSSKLAQNYDHDIDIDDADDEDYLYDDVYDDGRSPDSGSSEEGHHPKGEEDTPNEHSSEYSVQVEDEPVNCAEMYDDLENEIVDARQHLRWEIEEVRERGAQRREWRLEKKKQLMNAYMMYQEILKKIKKERDYLEDHIYQFLARRELTIKTEIKMIKDKKSRAERKLDLEWSKRLKEHRQKMDKKIAQKKMKKMKEAAERDRKRRLENMEMQMVEKPEEEDEENVSKPTDMESPNDGKPIEIIAKPDRKLQFSTSVMLKQAEPKKTKGSKKKGSRKRKNKAKAKRKVEREKAKEVKSVEKKEKKDHKHCTTTKKNPVDNPYARQMKLLTHFATASEQSSLKNAKRIAERQEMKRVKREELVEKRRIARRNERERKIILRIMCFLYPEVMEKIKNQKGDVPVFRFDRKKRLKAIQAKKLRNKKKLEMEPEPPNAKRKRVEEKVAKILKKTLEKRSKVSVSAAQEEYEKVLKRLLQLKLFWIECGKENQMKLNKISKRSEIAESKNKQLLEELLTNLRDVCENAYYSSSLKKIPRSETNQVCNEIFKMHQKMLSSSLKKHKLSKAVKVAKRQLKETQSKKRGRSDVQLLYEQFKADNQLLDVKLKSKNETRDRMEFKILQVVEMLAHFIEKIKCLQERLLASKSGYADLTLSVYKRRDTLAAVMLQFVDTKKAERGLNAEYGILQSSRMLQDLDDTRLHCEKLRDEERDLRRELAKRFREHSNIKYQMEIMQVKAEEIKSLAIKKAKETEMKKYKERMQEEMEKADRKRQKMKTLDSGMKGKLSIDKPVIKSNASDLQEEEEYSAYEENEEEYYDVEPYYNIVDE